MLVRHTLVKVEPNKWCLILGQISVKMEPIKEWVVVGRTLIKCNVIKGGCF